MGAKRAAKSTQALLAVLNPHFLASFGVAGAAEEDLQIGNVVLDNNTCSLEQGIPGQFHRLASFSNVARQAIAQAIAHCGHISSEL